MNSTFLSGEKESSFLCKIYILFKFFLELKSRQFKKKPSQEISDKFIPSICHVTFVASDPSLYLCLLKLPKAVRCPRRIVFNQNRQIEKCKRVNKNYKLLLNLLRKQILCCLFVNVAVLLATKFGDALVTSSYVIFQHPHPPKKNSFPFTICLISSYLKHL